MKEIALHIMDIMQNSVAADSSEISVGVRLLENDKWIQIIIADNGCGMDEETLKSVVDPFHTSRTTRKIGLGIPMMKEAAIMAEGDFSLESEKGKGTVMTVTFLNRSLDRQPLGDLGNLFFLMILSNGMIRLKLDVERGAKKLNFDSIAFAASLEGDDLTNMDVAFEAETYINEKVDFILKGALPETGGDLYGA